MVPQPLEVLSEDCKECRLPLLLWDTCAVLCCPSSLILLSFDFYKSFIYIMVYHLQLKVKVMKSKEPQPFVSSYYVAMACGNVNNGPLCKE